MEPVFDQFAKNYNEGHKQAVKMSGFDPSYFHEYKLQRVRSYLEKLNLADTNLKILNYGCGTGNSEQFIRKYLPQSTISSIDISSESVETARKSNSEIKNIEFAPFDGNKIPFQKEFDVVFIANVFHHIPRQQQLENMKDIFAHVKKGGYIFIFELNPLNPMTVLVFQQNDRKFDPQSNMLTPFYMRKLLDTSGFEIESTNYSIFFPKTFSSLIPYEKYMTKLPIGAHYYFIGKKI